VNRGPVGAETHGMTQRQHHSDEIVTDTTPRPSSSPRAPAVTLHHAWTRTVSTLLVLIFGLGLLALGATQYQRVAFERRTSGLRAEMGAIATLNHALVEVSGPPTLGMLYGDAARLAASRVTYRKVENTVNAAFRAADHVVSTPAEVTVLTRALRTWHAMDAAIVDAPTDFVHHSVQVAVAAGNDPFQQPVWNRLIAAEANVVSLAQLSATEPDQKTEAVGRAENLIAPIALGALALALLLSWLAARRLSRLVLKPIVSLRQAAMDIGRSTAEREINLPGASAELQDLAATFNETAASLRSSHELLHDQAYTDPLTGLPNRKAFTEGLRSLLAAQAGNRFGVLFVDLDDFKIVNDSLGHAAGDELLRLVARRLRAATRDCDLVARLGGDEFAIAVECGAQGAAATTVAVAERTLALLQEPATIYATDVAVSASIGIAISEAEPDADASESLLGNADISMYVAKGQGKNRLEVFAPAMHAEMVARIELKRELSQAARLNQFVLYYQPVIDIGTGLLIGFEALIRWQHPSRGLLAPAEFIALAEDTGDIIEIGRWVINRACADLADRRRQRDGSPDLWMSVNVSADQLLEPMFVDTVTSALERHGIPAGCLIVELTESVAITNTAVSGAALATLRQLGVHVALDDFGMGFSSLQYLHELPVDVIKIDRSFVTSQEGETHSMLEAIVTMGRSLDLMVIAEGIEEQSQLQRLRGFGRLAGQGYLIARPMPAEDAANFLRHNVKFDATVDLKPRPLILVT
jgi:diguanylate cyclase (GGDEF)-like protein